MASSDEFGVLMRGLHLDAGKPSTRAIASAIGGMSHTTVSQILNGRRVSSWESVWRVGDFLGAEEGQLYAAWSSVQSAKVAVSKMPTVDENWDPIYLDRIVVTSYIDDSGKTEKRVTERLITAMSDEIDRYVLRLSTIDGRSNLKEIEVKALMNCIIGDTREVEIPGSGGAKLVDALFPVPLNQGEKCFFATVVNYPSGAYRTHVAQVEVTAQGAGEVVIRVQMPPGSIPSRCWSYLGGSDVDMFTIPPDDSSRLLQISKLGYVEWVAHDVPPGVKLGIVWR